MRKNIISNKISKGVVAIIMATAPFVCFSQTTIIRPGAKTPKQPVQKVYSTKSKSQQPLNRAVKAASPSLDNIYSELEEKYEWHGELSEGKILVLSDGLYGYVDRTGKEIIPPVYEEASDFEDGEATVMSHNHYGRINSEGVMIIPTKYEQLFGPSEGFYAVRSDGKWGYIDLHNHKLTEINYDYAYPFVSGFGIVKKGQHLGALDRAGNEIIPVVFDDLAVDSIGKPIAVSLHGRSTDIDEFTNIDFTKLYDEIKPVSGIDSDELSVVKVDGKYGLVDRKFNELAPVKYRKIFPFKDGLARTQDQSGFNFINLEGNELLDEPLNDANDFVGDYARATRGNNPGVVDRRGNFQKVDFIGDIGVIKRSNKLALVSIGGVLLNEFLYDSIQPFVDGRAIVLRAGNYGFIDGDGFEVVKPIYNKVYDYEEGAARVRLHDLWGLVAKNGEYLAAPRYQRMEPFVDGLSLVEKSHQFGYIGHDGRERVHTAYDSISAFESSGRARTLKNGKHGLVDKEGHEIVIASYDYILPFSDGLYAVGLDEKCGYMDADGNVTVKLKYDETLPFVNGLGAVRKKDKWGAIDVTGKTIIPIKYDPINDLSGETITVYKKGEATTYSREGKKL